MITAKSSVENRLFDWQEQQQSNTKNDIDVTLFWTRNFIVLSIGSILITFIVTFLAVIYWCSKQQKLSKTKSHSSELTSFTTHPINVKTPRPKEIKLFPIIPKLVQPNISPILLPIIEDNNNNNIHGDRFTTDTCSTADSSSSSTAVATKKFRKKNLLER
ncbi:unnamed protein product [Rotaria sp. Silwood1]|nr:unnamed protein product [Rotaria sp. Silwood1]